MQVTVDYMLRGQTAAVLEIEAESVGGLTKPDLTALLMQRTIIAWTAVAGGEVVGWLMYEMHRRHFDIVAIGVRADCRRQRVGTQMIAKLQGKMKPGSREHIAVECLSDDIEEIEFFMSCGFRLAPPSNLGVRLVCWREPVPDGGTIWDRVLSEVMP